jgi:hypothetical protein
MNQHIDEGRIGEYGHKLIQCCIICLDQVAAEQ